LLALLLAVVLAFAACGDQETPAGGGTESESQGEETDSTEPRYKETVVVGVHYKVVSIDCQAYSDIGHAFGNMMTAEPLVHYRGETQEFIPKLAESWEVSEDAKVYTFHLREGVTFHNGEPFTSDDVIFTIDKGLDNGSSTIKNIYGLFESYTAPDDYTVVITLKNPNVDLLITMANTGSFGMLNREACEADPVDGPAIGTGPWVNEDWMLGDYITKTRFDDYWGELPVTKEVILRYIPEASARLIALETGEIDVCVYPAPIEFDYIRENEDLELVAYDGALHYLFYNNQKAPFDDVNFRLAVTYAMNVDEIITGAVAGNAAKAYSFGAPYQLGYFDDWESIDMVPYEYNLELAKEYLAKSKYANGGGDFDIAVNNTERAVVAQVIQAQMKALGINVTVNEYDSAGFASGQAEAQFCSSIASTGYTNSSDDVRRNFYTEGGLHHSKYSNLEVDALFDAAVGEMDLEKRLEMYKQIQILLHQDCPAYPMYYKVEASALNKNVSGIFFETRGYYEFAYIKAEIE
jgi:peptide/nickel transport system substrate-binding protein